MGVALVALLESCRGVIPVGSYTDQVSVVDQIVALMRLDSSPWG